jgi:hypothetical protein
MHTYSNGVNRLFDCSLSQHNFDAFSNEKAKEAIRITFNKLVGDYTVKLIKNEGKVEAKMDKCETKCFKFYCCLFFIFQ